MKKIVPVIGTLLLSMSLFGCSSSTNTDSKPPIEKSSDGAKEADFTKEAVRIVVEKFGSRLQTVSLLAPVELLKKDMLEQYGGLVAKPLLDQWIQNPQSAPGRQTSSPWPDRIEIVSVEKQSDTAYKVVGKIIEITSEEQEHGGIAAKRPIELTVEKVGEDTLITAVTLGKYEVQGISYQNNDYGFAISLPKIWKEYTILTEKWEGTSPENGQVVESGPKLLIRHPQWTKENPRQDIPILVFTPKQWEEMQKDQFHIGAAPMNPSKLGANDKYIFALPARYNYAFPTGYEEVEEILTSGAFHAL